MKPYNWYEIRNIDELDTPCLVVYPERIENNIQTLIKSVSDINQLRPHIKTHKSPDVTKLMLQAGITRFKCATIAEAEMLGSAGAPDVLLAYQPVGPKAKRLVEIIKQYPITRWACLIDNIDIATDLSKLFEEHQIRVNVFIDLNVGMNRTGIVPEKSKALFDACAELNGVDVIGLHAYDGHLRDTDFKTRRVRCDEGFNKIRKLQQEIEQASSRQMIIVVGGTPTFSIHCTRKNVECSPGTFIYWDKGYEDILQEQKYDHAALVVTRLVSKPTDGIICLDLGHKAIASENPLANRVFFINAPDLQPIGHSEEHMVFKVPEGRNYEVGHVFYGVPFHICPTVALHDIAYPIMENRFHDRWQTSARKRKITL
jgi:D-threonine aldolase